MNVLIFGKLSQKLTTVSVAFEHFITFSSHCIVESTHSQYHIQIDRLINGLLVLHNFVTMLLKYFFYQYIYFKVSHSMLS